jgi:hypothetical protein
LQKLTMPLLQRFDPPAYLNDFDGILGMREAWHRFLSLTFDAAIDFKRDVVRARGRGPRQRGAQAARGKGRLNFLYSTRDFARACQTPMLVMPDDTPGHPYQVSMDIVALAPKAEVTLYPWKDTPELKQQAVRHVRDFLHAHQPVTSAR